MQCFDAKRGLVSAAATTSAHTRKRRPVHRPPFHLAEHAIAQPTLGFVNPVTNRPSGVAGARLVPPCSPTSRTYGVEAEHEQLILGCLVGATRRTRDVEVRKSSRHSRSDR